MAAKRKTSGRGRHVAKKKLRTRQRGGNSLLELLKQDHDRVKELWGEMEGDGAIGSKEDLLDHIQKELDVHIEGEEKFFYPVLEKSEDARDKVLEAYEEHHVAKTVLGELDDVEEEDGRWTAKLKVFKEILEHHIHEEEKEIFKLAKRTLDKYQLEEISEQIQQQKTQMHRV